VIAWTVVILLFVIIVMQPGPKRRPRGRHRYHHRDRHHHRGTRTTKKADTPSVDPDVISALRNLGYSAKESKAAAQRSTTAVGFEARLKQSLVFLR